jgi:DNA-binding HxlR family transcriptional regulator
MESAPRYDVYNAHCPTRRVLDRIADKWASLLVILLAERPHRFGELKRRIDGISQKMLTQTLRNLERDGLVNRQAFATVPVTVEYSLTPLGQSLVGPVSAIRAWAETHIEAVLAAQAEAERRDQRLADDGR